LAVVSLPRFVLALPFAQGAIIGEAGCSGSTGKVGRLRMIRIERDAMADQHSCVCAASTAGASIFGNAMQQLLVFMRARPVETSREHEVWRNGFYRFLVRGVEKVNAVALWHAIAYNFLQMPRLMLQAA
jgi:hypothetical protein